MEIMGLPLWAWILFYASVLLMLIADLRMFGRKGPVKSLGRAKRT